MNFYQTVRRLTAAPILAGALLIILGLHRRTIFSSPWQWSASLLFLTVLPLLAYPPQRYFPRFREQGRRGQRTLAMIFAVAGYLLGCVSCLIFPTSPALRTVYLEYLLCGIVLLLVNKVFRRKASGHACGVTGPVLLLLYFGLYPQAAAGAALTVLTWIASIRTGRHTLPQLLAGSLISLAAMAVLAIVSGIF